MKLPMIFWKEDSVSVGGLGGDFDDVHVSLDDFDSTPQVESGGLETPEESPPTDQQDQYALMLKQNQMMMDFLMQSGAQGYGANAVQRWTGTPAMNLGTMQGLRRAAGTRQISGTDFFKATGRIFAGGTGDVVQRDKFGNITGYTSPDGSGSSLHSGSNAMSNEAWASRFYGSGSQMKSLSGTAPNTPNPMVRRNPGDTRYKTAASVTTQYAY